MKFSELKSKFKNKYVMRVIAGVLCIAVLGAGYGTYKVSAAKVPAGESVEEATEAATEETTEKDIDVKDEISQVIDDIKSGEAKDIGKEETVYLIAGADGTVNETIVSDWLKNADGSATLEDTSDLQEIENVKGDEKFTQNGTDLTWQADGNDIFYQGTTTKEAPVSEKITYSLDGKEMKPEDIAGKSGKVTIRFDYTNNEKTTAMIDGKEEEIYVPFTVVTGMVLDDNFKNVQVTNGKLISDGKNNAVVGIAMPGLKESLNVDAEDFDGDVDIPDYVEVTADVENFSLEMTMSAVVNGLQTAGTDSIDLTDLDDAINTLTDSSSQLVDGSGTLSDGAATLANAIEQYTDGAQTLSDGIGTLADSAPALTAGAGTLASGTQSLASGTQSLASGAQTLASGTQSLANGTKGLATGAQNLANGTQSLLTGTQQIATGISDARQGADTLNSNVQALAAGVPQLINGLSTQAQSYGTQGANVDADKQALQAALTDYTTNVTTAVAAATAQAVMQGQDPTAAAQAAAQGVDSSAVMAAVQQLGSDAGAQGAATALNEVSSQLAGGGLTVENINALASGVSSLDSGLQQLDTGAASLVTGASQVNEGAAQLNTGASQVSSGADQVNTGASQLSSGANQVNEGANQVNAGAGQLNSGAGQLKSGVDQLQSGAKTLVANNTDLKTGAFELRDGAKELADGMEEFDSDGIKKIADAYNGDVKTLLDRLDAVIDAGNNYQIFSQVKDGTNGSVKFIIKTDSVKVDDEDKK